MFRVVHRKTRIIDDAIKGVFSTMKTPLERPLSVMKTRRLFLTIMTTVLLALITPAILWSPPAAAAEKKDSREVSAKQQLSQNINTLVSNLPILPPEKATRPFDSKLKVSGLPVSKFFRLLSREPFLDMNMVIATNSENLNRPFDVDLSEITVGELFNLLLQLNGFKAVRFNENTLIIVNASDDKTYGVKTKKTYHLSYFMPSKLVEFIEDDSFLKSHFNNTTFIPNDVQKNILVIGTRDEMTLVDYIINLLDRKPNKIHARIPLSNMEFDDLKSSLTEMLPEDISSAIDTERWVYSEAGRAILVYDDPTTVKLLRKLVSIIDIPPKQVLIDIALMEVSSNFSREIGMKLGSSSFTIDSLDKLFSLSRLSRALEDIDPAQTSISYLIQQSGGRALASPKVRCLDGETADINIGEIRNIRVQSTEFNSTTGGSSQQTTFNTQEVPIGVQLNVMPEIHNDGTVTLELSISDEAVLQVQDFGVDRTTRNSTTKLRIKDGETVIMGGFISQNRDWDKTPIPLLGHLPLIGRLFRAGRRTKIETELVFLITPYILDFEKQDKEDFKEKTIADLRRDYTKDLNASDVETTTTRWIEDDKTKTKLIMNAEGEVIYRQTWSKASGKAVGRGIDMRSDAQRKASEEQGLEGPSWSQEQSLEQFPEQSPERSQEQAINGAQEQSTDGKLGSSTYIKERKEALNSMSKEELRALMNEPLEPPVPVAPTPSPQTSSQGGEGSSSEQVASPVPKNDDLESQVEPSKEQSSPASGEEGWDQLLDRLDGILDSKKGA